MQIARTLYQQINDHLSQPEITLITGPRQVGKTTIIKHLQQEREAAGAKTMYLNLDIESDFALFASQETLLFAIRNQVGDEKAFIFIDEYQRKPDGGRFLKGIYDMGLPYKFIITGSGSIELKEQVHESLAGRKRQFTVPPVSFDEYLAYETGSDPGMSLSDYAQVYPERTQLYLRNYLTFGGYPKVVLTDGVDEKRAVMREIYSSYLLKDITALLQIEKTASFQKLVENLSVLDGKLINVSNLAKHTGIASQTIEKYLWYLEQTYIINPVRPFSRNPLKEINKSYTYYFTDIGLKNLISAQFDAPSDRVELGFDFQNFVYLQLIHILGDTLSSPVRFWRTTDGAEVDFIVEQGKKLIGIECKYVPYTEPSYTRSMRSFISKYRPPVFYIINMTLTHTARIDETEVRFLPFWRMGGIKK
jgi:hypothetical protein